MDRLRAFEIFVAVVDKGGFSHAAEALGTSPANATRYVKDLEAHLGTRLLNRNPRQVSLTRAGQALYERARGILTEVADVEAAASSEALVPRGQLRIGAPQGFGARYLAPLWPRFMRLYPGVALEVCLDDRAPAMVEEGYDLVVCTAQPDAASVGRLLATSRDLVCAAPAYLARHPAPARPEDLKEHFCIGCSNAPQADTWPFVDPEGRAHTITVKLGMQSNNSDTLLAAALAGQGVIIHPAFMLADDLRAGRLTPLLTGYRLPETAIRILFPSARHVSARLRAMVDFLVQSFDGAAPWEHTVPQAVESDGGLLPG